MRTGTLGSVLHFKDWNDTFGHALLRRLADLLQAYAEGDDLAALPNAQDSRRAGTDWYRMCSEMLVWL